MAVLAGSLPSLADPERWPATTPESATALMQAIGIPERALPAGPSGPQPLEDALAAYLQIEGYPVPAELGPAVARLRLAPEAESAVAQLITAFEEARSLQDEALRDLSGPEIELLALHPAAVNQWFVDHPDGTDEGLQADLAALVTRIDVAKSLEAASLLARSVEAARPALGLPGTPAPHSTSANEVDSWSSLEAHVAAAFGEGSGAAPPMPGLPLPEALGLLAAAAGQPAPDASVIPVLPAGVAQALSRLAVAHAYAMAGQDPLLGGLAVLDAAQQAAPALDALAAWRQLPILPGLPGAPDLPGSPAASAAMPANASALQDMLTHLSFASASAQSSGPVPGDAGPASGTPIPSLGPPANGPDLPLPPQLKPFLVDRDGDGIGDALEALAGTDSDDAESHPVGGSFLQGLPVQLLPATDGPLVMIGRPGLSPSEPAILILGDVGDETVTRTSLLHIDLGGSDHYLVPVGTSTNLLVELAGNDVYDTPKVDATQGAATGLGAAILLDLAGNDRYLANERSQGSACCGVGVIIDPGNPPDIPDAPADVPDALNAAFWRAFEDAASIVQGQAGGLGLLADLGGNDTYTGGLRSQGYANNLLLTAIQGTLEPSFPLRGTAGILFDGAGTDSYRFTTQGFAEVTEETSTGDWEARPVGLFVDESGNDTYDNRPNQDRSLMPVSDGDTSERLFLSQGYARSVESTAAPSPTGVFLDLGGNDTYLLPALDGSVARGAKNNVRQDPNPPQDNTAAPVRFFLDSEPADVQEMFLDTDHDGTPSILETLAGTNPEDPEDTPGRALSDPNGTANAPFDGPLLRVPGLLREPTAGTLVLPGLVIGGRLDDTYSETFDFFLDLGGNDTYLAAGHGGAAIPDLRESTRARPAVRLAVDVGGDDDYRPQDGPLAGVQVGRHNRTYGSAPSLGGAHLGVSVMVDLGGVNTFQSSLLVAAKHEKASTDTGDAAALGWGTTMGAGLFGGVGVLLTSNASNTFNARVDVTAEDFDKTPQATAAGFTVTQGAGFLGVGVLANLGSGRDEYHADAKASVPPSPHGAQNRFGAVAQGAGMSGLGLLVDGGGDNAFDAPAGFAQGVGWGLTLRTGATLNVGSSPPLEDDQSAQIIEAGVGVGLLISGGGDDVYVAAGPAQGAGGADQELGYLQESKFGQQTGYLFLRGGSGQGLLLDLGGDDSYRVPAASPGLKAAFGPSSPLVAQAAALADSVGVLADLAGDDHYWTGPGNWSQAAAVAGVAVLLDLEGQDFYEAGDAAQGYAQAAVLGSAREHVCLVDPSYLVPCNLPAPIVSGT
ncbi:MAG: hypothetical protein WC876_08445, partial [Candidatus Thermoplasmatota archaeon]